MAGRRVENAYSKKNWDGRCAKVNLRSDPKKTRANCSIELIDTSLFLRCFPRTPLFKPFPLCPPSNGRQARWPIHCAVSRARWCIPDEQPTTWPTSPRHRHPLAIFHPTFLSPIECTARVLDKKTEKWTFVEIRFFPRASHDFIELEVIYGGKPLRFEERKRVRRSLLP